MRNFTVYRVCSDAAAPLCRTSRADATACGNIGSCWVNGLSNVFMCGDVLVPVQRCRTSAVQPGLKASYKVQKSLAIRFGKRDVGLT